MAADIICSDVEMRSNAMHEAAHAVMCLMKKVGLGNVEIYKSPRNGRLGICQRGPTSHWSEEVWISLAGPIATAFYEKNSFSHQYSGGGSSDFRKAYSSYLKLIAPSASSYGVELNLSDDDLESFLERVIDGWCPPDVKGVQKRRLRRFAADYMNAVECAVEIVHTEANKIAEFIKNSPVFMKLCSHIADELVVRKCINGHEWPNLLREIASKNE